MTASKFASMEAKKEKTEGKRRQGRSRALQLLYALELNPQPYAQGEDEFLQINAKRRKGWGDFPHALASKTYKDRDRLDAEIAKVSALGKFKDRATHLVLPATSLALVLAAGIARYTRGSMLEVIRQDFVRTARAKGLSERTVIMKHALRNALIPVITLVGLYLPFLFSGTVFIESVFAWPGMGKLVFDAIVQRDYPVIMGGTLVFANMVVLGNLVADILYAVVDPRIRYD